MVKHHSTFNGTKFCAIDIAMWQPISLGSYHWCNLRLHACLFIYFWINQAVLHPIFSSYWQTFASETGKRAAMPLWNFKTENVIDGAVEWNDGIASHRTIKTNFTKHGFIIIIHRQSSALIQLRFCSCHFRVGFFLSVSWTCIASILWANHNLALGIHRKTKNHQNYNFTWKFYSFHLKKKFETSNYNSFQIIMNDRERDRGNVKVTNMLNASSQHNQNL